MCQYLMCPPFCAMHAVIRRRMLLTLSCILSHPRLRLNHLNDARIGKTLSPTAINSLVSVGMGKVTPENKIKSQSARRKCIRITSVNSTNQASDVCRRTTSGSDNNNPHTNVNNNMTTSNVFDFKQYEVDRMYSPQCERETLYCYNNARSIKRHSLNF